ncbi:MAG: hypothetical protein DRJ98_01695 [Thermoprotei archaeon]|nr:MAG: hypothetical protein DRJ98_01695 [Thermoprotei archaeon]RLF17796.1 MAG: hypothetical protein DRN06_03100 [Thermoprotei archaeon]
MAEENPLLTLPRPIIEALFRSAEVEAQRVKMRVAKLAQAVEQVKPLFRFTPIKQGRGKLVVAADGSMSPTSSQRLGSEFAIYTAGYLAFKDREVVGERYYAGSLSWVEGLQTFRTLLRLLMAYTERKAALEAYRKYKPDYVILDGPYFYFRGHCRHLRNLEIDVEGLSTGLELIRKVRDMTLELMNTGRAICVIRRSVMRAIDGWLLYHHGEEACLRARDKHILTMVMPPMSLWSYQTLLDRDPILYATYYRFYRRRKQEGKLPKELEAQRDRLMEQARRDWERKFREDLDMNLNQAPRTQRYYLRYTASMPPFEVEAVEGIDVEDFASTFTQFYNEATGLPFPVDLIDNFISLPRGSTTAFTEEVEARLIRDQSIKDKTTISDYFTYLNPQKKEQA